MPQSFHQNDFPIPTREQWLERVETTLKGADYKKRLVSKSDDGIEIDPLGGPWVEVKPEWPGVAPYTRGPAPLPPQPAPWTVGQVILDAEPRQANKTLMEALSNGAASVDLLIADGPEAQGIVVRDADDLAAVLEGVFIEAVPVRIDAGGRGVELAKHLVAVWDNKGTPKGERSGGFGIDPLGALAKRGRIPGTIADHVGAAASLVAELEGYSNFQLMNVDTRPYHAAGATEGQELAIALATGVAYLRGLNSAGVTVEQALSFIGFTLVTDSDVIVSIAKLRAFRRLWAQVADACGVTPQPAWIAAESARRMITKRDPWVNMLRVTAAAFAAGVAGANLIVVTPFNAALGQPDGFARRIARNVQLVLQEESGIGRVADPAGGAWAIESLTDALAEKAWRLFQELERQGGMEAALAAGHVQKIIQDAADLRARDYAKRKRLVTGVSAFPKLDEEPAKTGEPARPAATAEFAPASFAGETVVIALRPRPLAEDFEALRDRSDAILKAKGKRPQIFLANLGRLADFNTRATWARNLFEAGGIEAVPGTGYGSAPETATAFGESGAAIAIICSTDSVYETMAVPAAAALKEAGAKAVYLAGRPGEAEQALTAAGIDDFLFEGADVLAALQQAYDILKMDA